MLTMQNPALTTKVKFEYPASAWRFYFGFYFMNYNGVVGLES